MTEKRDELQSGDEQERSASGLDETQIDEADLRQLREAVALHRLETGFSYPVRELDRGWIPPELPAASVNRADVAFTPRKPVRMRFALLPNRISVNKLKLPDYLLHVHHSLAAACRQPVRRDKLEPRQVSLEFEEKLNQKLLELLGAEAPAIELLGVFPNVPPEASQTVQVDSELRWATFLWNPKLKPARARPGFFLVVFRDRQKRTKKMLVRL